MTRACLRCHTGGAGQGRAGQGLMHPPELPVALRIHRTETRHREVLSVRQHIHKRKYRTQADWPQPSCPPVSVVLLCIVHTHTQGVAVCTAGGERLCDLPGVWGRQL
jgi:hypothetical protein